ncbi:MAG: hypothetical protein JRH18_24925 [Deltaproteobacteria bacterium]|nr:hypothetical protein [Deltaproteobacteria bacterium]MBW2154887.1 hypothetical protein [Deltaproteobacteria bacterium]
MSILKTKIRGAVYYFMIMGVFVFLWHLISLWVDNRLLVASPVEVALAPLSPKFN